MIPVNSLLSPDTSTADITTLYFPALKLSVSIAAMTPSMISPVPSLKVTVSPSVPSSLSFAIVVLYDCIPLLSLIVPTMSVIPDITPSFGDVMVISGGTVSLLSTTVTIFVFVAVFPAMSVAFAVMVISTASALLHSYLPYSSASSAPLQRISNDATPLSSVAEPSM